MQGENRIQAAATKYKLSYIRYLRLETDGRPTLYQGNFDDFLTGQGEAATACATPMLLETVRFDLDRIKAMFIALRRPA
jgi:hypothetical protein